MLAFCRLTLYLSQDALGIKRLLIIELWIFIAGNIIAGTSQNLVQLVAGRILSGVGGAGIFALSVIIISRQYHHGHDRLTVKSSYPITELTHERQRGSYLNLISVVFIVSDSVAPFFGAALSKSGHWRWM